MRTSTPNCVIVPAIGELSILIELDGKTGCQMADSRNLIRPLLSMAIFCEKILKEADGVVSAIRIIDRYTISGTTDEMPIATVHFTIVIGFKSASMRGPARLRIAPNDPNGKKMNGFDFALQFEGDDDRGSMLAAEMDFPLQFTGVYWFDVILEEELVTSMPLRVVYQRQPRAQVSG